MAPRALLLVLGLSTVAAGGYGVGCDFVRLMELLQEAERAGEPTTTAKTRRRAMWAACVALDEAEPLKLEISARCSSEALVLPTSEGAPPDEPPSGWRSWLGWLPPPPPPPLPLQPPSPPPPPRSSLDETEADRTSESLCDFTALLTCSEVELSEIGGDPFCLSHKQRCYNVARSFAP
mgnify:CR=1 FL=1